MCKWVLWAGWVCVIVILSLQISDLWTVCMLLHFVHMFEIFSFRLWLALLWVSVWWCAGTLVEMISWKWIGIRVRGRVIDLFKGRLAKDDGSTRSRRAGSYAYVVSPSISMYVVGTKPSSHSPSVRWRRTRVQPSPWSCSITCSSSFSFIGMLPSLLAEWWYANSLLDFMNI